MNGDPITRGTPRRALDIRVVQAVTPDEIAATRVLFSEYVSSLDFDLGFQQIDAELAGLPGRYAPPSGRLLLAWADDTPAGCVGLRSLDATTGEVKRLWVRPVFRGHGLARRLVETLIDEARAAGYQRLRLDTLATMTEALALYRSFGFAEIPPYYDNPMTDVVYLERLL